MDRMLGVWTRKFARVAEPVGEEIERASSSKRKSTVSEMFIEKTRTALGELIARRLEDMRLAVMMLDGLEIVGRVHVVALGVTTEGVKVPLGLWEGSTENATLARSLLADLVDRGLDPGQAILFVSKEVEPFRGKSSHLRRGISPLRPPRAIGIHRSAATPAGRADASASGAMR